MTYLDLDMMTYFLTLWRACLTFWRYDVLFDVMTYFLTSWRTFFVVMTYFLTISRTSDITYLMAYFFSHLGVLYSLLFEVWRIFPQVLTSWLTFWWHDVHLDGMTDLFDVMTYFMTYVLTSLRALYTFWWHCTFLQCQGHRKCKQCNARLISVTYDTLNRNAITISRDVQHQQLKQDLWIGRLWSWADGYLMPTRDMV